MRNHPAQSNFARCVAAAAISLLSLGEGLDARAATTPQRRPTQTEPRQISMDEAARRVADGESYRLRLLEGDFRVVFPERQAEARGSAEGFLTKVRERSSSQKIESSGLSYTLEWNRLSIDGLAVYDIGDHFRA